MWEPDPDTTRRARAGDAGAFEEIVRAYLPDVFRLARHLTGSNDVAEDVVQESFLQAYRSLPRFKGRSRFSTWLFRIVRNCSVDAIRRSQRERRRTMPVDRAVADPSTRVALRLALNSLPSDLREPFVVIEVFGFTYPEAAKILRLPSGTLKSRMHRARKVLSGALAEEDAGEM